MSTQRMLIALDFSSCAENVARQGGEIARQLGARPTLLHVVPLPDAPLDSLIPVGEGSAVRELTVEEYLRGSAQLRLAKYAEALGESDAPPRLVVRFGHAADAIVDEAQQTGASLIVMGTRGRTGLARAVLGSTAAEVVRSAPMPVTTIRSHWHAGCAVRSCNWCTEEATPEEQRVADEQFG